jgi:hypothetical protein
VRYYVAQYSASAAEQWARSKGASDAEIEAARRCLKPDTDADGQGASEAARARQLRLVNSGTRPWSAARPLYRTVFNTAYRTVFNTAETALALLRPAFGRRNMD